MAARRAKAPRVGALLLAPGAGASSQSPSLVAIEAAVAPLPVERMDFPYRLAGRKAPDRPPVLLDAVPSRGGGAGRAGRRGAGSARARRPVDGRAHVLDGGRRRAAGRRPSSSSPTRCTRRAGRTTCAPRTSRRSTVPCLFVQGTRDPFGSPDELTAATATIPGPVTHEWIDGGRHDLKGADRRIGELVAAWLSGLGPS